MDMLELISMVNDMDQEILFTITLEELPPIKVWVASPEDEYYCKKKLHPSSEVKHFWDKEEVIAFLFDKDVFGWEVRSWDLNENWSEVTEFYIDLYRFNCD